MELVLVGKQYELYKPVKPPAQKNRMQKMKNPSLEKLVADINQRMASANMAEGTQGLEAVKSGLWQIEKEKSLEESFQEMMKSMRVSGVGSGSVGDFVQQLKDTHFMLTNMKEYVDIIGKYEGLAADETKSEEERQFFQEALENLKKGFQKELYFGFGSIQTQNMSRLSSEELKKNLGLTGLEGLDSGALMKKLDAAIGLLEKMGYGEGGKRNFGGAGENSLGFEIRNTIGIKGSDKYGVKIPPILDFSEEIKKADSPYLKGTLYVSNLNEYHLLDTRA